MTDTNSVWEQNFRQPLDADVTTELGRLAQQVAQTNALAVTNQQTNTTQDTALGTKAPLNNPTFTGDVIVPTVSPPWASGSKVLNQNAHINAHGYARWQYASGAASSVGAGWVVFPQAGVLSANTGGQYTLGAGGLGVNINTAGYYHVIVNYQYVVSTHPSTSRVITGLSYNGGVSEIIDSNIVVNLAGISYQSVSWSGMLSVMNLRPMVFVEGGATLSVTPRYMSVLRIA